MKDGAHENPYNSASLEDAGKSTSTSNRKSTNRNNEHMEQHMEEQRVGWWWY